MNLLYLSKEDVQAVDLPMGTMIEALEQMFLAKGRGETEMPPKPGIHPNPPGGGDNFIHAMPAYIPSMKAAGIKWVSGYPENSKQGLPYISGLIILNDPNTGIPLCVMDASWITAKRTAAASAVAAKRFAPTKPESLGLLACGVQGHSHVEAMTTLYEFNTIRAFDVRAEAAHALKAAFPHLPIEVVPTPEDAVRDSDIVVTSGPILKKPTPTLEAQWLKEGCFLSAVDFDSYLKPEAQTWFDQVVTDDHAQMEYYRSAGYFQQTPKAHADLGEVMVGESSLTLGPSTLCINLGLALDDMATGILVYNEAKRKGLGRSLPL